MDYKKAYEEALERAKSYQKWNKSAVITAIFPELKESEGERIRQDIINTLSIGVACVESAVHPGAQTTLKEAINWLEKQGEQNLLARQYLVSKGYPVNTGGDIPTYEELYEIIKEGIINVDKCEPKFKVGDWITDNNSTFQIVRVENEWYYADDGDKICFDVAHQYYRLWTIEDAKSGDVLITKDGKPFIFKDFSDVKHHNKPTAHCGINTLNNFIIDSSYYRWTDKEVYPATKEQRDLLFQKMKEAGYKWENNQLEEINNKGVVDLGLPSGTLWAKCNLGAEKETDFGKFFQWGDVKGYNPDEGHNFNWDNYKWGAFDNLVKYNNDDEKLVLDNEDDPVFAVTNGMFKMPTKEQLQELIDYTNHEWTSIDGVKGMKCTNKNDDTKYIFIPAAGYCIDSVHNDVGFWGCLWSVSRKESRADSAWNMSFSSSYISNDYFLCCNGFSVRGVM
jgi:hypothetical protein